MEPPSACLAGSTRRASWDRPLGCAVSQEPLADRPLSSADSPPKPPLPSPLTSLLGRERELADVQRLLSTARLVTLTGPGGVGKTSLALQVARELSETFTDGAHFVSLAAITDPTLVIPTLAQALGLAESPHQLLFDNLKDFLRDRQALLVLDNFEQVVSAAPLLTELLASCAGLRMLVTSRETLRLQGEHEFSLRPLALSSLAEMPDPLSVATLVQYPAIALFVQRAQASQPEFKLTAENAAAVAEVCARLDGLPLAIELAAARIKLLPPKAMLVRLQESALGVLTSGPRDAPARQQTLRATVQWSYDLLNDDEQRAFRRLAVFVDGCTLEAATHVLGDDAPVVLERVTALIDKSLVRQTERDADPRLGMLETIREFGLERLTQMSELEAVQRAHAGYYLSLAEETEPHLTGRERKAWLNRLGREQDNLRAALRWGFDHHEARFVLRLVGALWQFWFLRGQWSEGRRWLEDALDVASSANVTMALRAKVLYGAATLIRYQYDVARARALCEQSVTLYHELNDKVGLLAALHLLCRILDFQGDLELLRARLPEALALAEELPDMLIKAQVFAELPMIGLSSIRAGRAARYLVESERIYRVLDNPAGLAFALVLQGQIAAIQGDMARAQVLWDEGEPLAAEVDDYNLKLHILFGHPVLAWLRGDDALARRQYEHLFVALREVNDTIRLGMSLAFLPAILHRQGLSVWAARVYGLEDKLAKTSVSSRWGGELFDTLMQRAATARDEVRARLGDKAFAQALAEGQSMTVDDLLAIPQPPPTDSTTQAPASVPSEPLTARELDVLRLLAQDFSNPQIAERLVVSRRTIEAHLRSIYGKFGVKAREAAIRYAIEHGLIEK
jgi:predicted ATPase/DNA-binding CsgD family transcriptional regulator